MQPGKTLRARLGPLTVAAVPFAWLFMSPAASAMAPAPSAGDLSPRLAELAKPSVRSLPAAAQARMLGLARGGPGSLLRDGNRVIVEARVEGDPAERLAAVRQAGAQVLGVSNRYRTISLGVKPAELRALDAVPGVASVTETLRPMTFAPTGCPSGGTVSEGNIQLHAGEARSQFGVDGTGITVGILSDSFNRASTAADGSGPAATKEAQDIASGDLPGAKNPCGYTTPTNLVDDSYAKGEDEGRAMTQIVHDLAPGAKLAFATAFIDGELGFAKNIERLAAPVSSGGAGARVIADDVAYFEEPFFQDGPIAVAAAKAVAAGVDYLSAAGNDNLIDTEGHEFASWEASEFRDSLSCPVALTAITALAATHCMDFNPTGGTDNTFGIDVEEGAVLTVDLQWAEPWYGVKTDLDAFLLDSSGTPISTEEGAQDNVGGTQRPVEIIEWENNTGSPQEVQLAINRCSGSCNFGASETATPRVKVALLENGGGVSDTEYPASSGGDVVGPTIFGHAGSAAVLSIGAVPFNSSSKPEKYSSRGPVTHYYGPVTSTSPAPKLASPETLAKPDLAATDCGVTTFFAFKDANGRWRFCGTSAAAPHAAAVAALLLQRNPLLSPFAVRSVLSSTASPVGEYGPDAVGAGLANAMAALQAVEPAASPRGSEQPGGVQEQVTSAAAAVSASPSESNPLQLRVFLVRHPRKVVRTARRAVRLSFRFGSNRSDAQFICKVDKHPFRSCGRTMSRRYRLGRHVVRVSLRQLPGTVAPVPLAFRFRVEPLRR